MTDDKDGSMLDMCLKSVGLICLMLSPSNIVSALLVDGMWIGGCFFAELYCEM